MEKIREKDCKTLGKFGAVKEKDGVIFQVALEEPEEAALLRDREALLAQIRAALEGRRDLKPEFLRAL